MALPISMLLSLALTLGLASVPNEAEPPPTLERVGGLSHNTVLSLLQDHRGYLWIGTDDGLNRYDGYGMTVFRHDPRDDATLSENTIRALAEDADGMLWVGTEGGLNRLDPATGRVQRYQLGAQESVRINTLALDAEGRLWVIVYGDEKGLFRYDRETDTFRHYQVLQDEQRGQWLHALVDRHGVMWGVLGAGDDYVARFDTPRDRFVPVPVGEIDGGADDRTAWAAKGGRVGRWRLGSGAFEPVLTLPFPTNHASFVETEDGRLWAGTEDGLFLADPDTKVLHPVSFGDEGTELSQYVWVLLQDRTGIVWVGTRSGLFRYDPNRKAFQHLTRGGEAESGGSPVMALAQTDDRTLWTGTLGEGLMRRPATEANTIYRHRPGNTGSLPNDAIWALHAVPPGGTTLWMGTEAGLASFDRTTGRFRRHRLPVAGRPDGLEAVSAVYSIVPAWDERIWVVSPWDVYRIEPTTGAIEQHLRVGEQADWKTTQTVHSAQAQPRVLWVGTEVGGLMRYDLDTDRLTRYPTGARDASGLPGQTVWTIHEDGHGDLWLGTDLGLVRFDPEAETFHLHYDPEVLSGALVYSILEDDAGRLWLGTNRGLAVFDPATGAFRLYDERDGIGNIEFNRRAATRGVDGTFYFGGLDGVTAFRPEAIRDNPHPPPVRLTDVRVFDGQGARAIPLPHGGMLQLGPDEDTFEFSFAALGFTDSARNRYRYRLDGFDDGWVEAGTNRQARYTNVPPGDYVFRVRAANNDGVWNNEGSALSLSLAPPYWQMWWFRFLVGVAIATLLAVLYRWRVGHLLAVERLRLRIAADLHDDVGSRLSGIALLSELVRDRAALPEPERAELSRIGAEARRLVGALRDIVWFIVPEHDRAGALVERMQDAAASLLGTTPYTFRAAPDVTLGSNDPTVRRNVFLIYREALHNIAQHADAEQVEIVVRREGGGIVLRITDDGIGFNGTATRGNGLANMQRRAEDIGGALDLESGPGTGTTVCLTVPVRAWK